MAGDIPLGGGGGDGDGKDFLKTKIFFIHFLLFFVFFSHFFSNCFQILVALLNRGSFWLSVFWLGVLIKPGRIHGYPSCVRVGRGSYNKG